MVVATKQQLVSDYKQTSLGWQTENLKIVNKQSQLVPLHHNIAQLKVYNAMQLQIKYGLPVMLLIYKARQEGISTYIEACIFERINRKDNWHGCVVSVDDTSTNKVFKMCEIYQQEMPEEKKRRTDRSSAKEIRYAAPHRSSLLCQTAGTKTLGRGGTTQGVHATEVTFWANAERQLLGLLQEVPDAPDTMIVLETTANGVGNAFSKRYWAAVKRMRDLYKVEDGVKEIDPTVLRGYLPIFLSWQDFPEYQTPLPPGCSEVPGITPEMMEYVKEGEAMGITLSSEQIYFALLTIQNKCGGDIDLFKQEYPRTAREAERATGRVVFSPIDLDIMGQCCKPPVANVEFYEAEGGKVKYRHVNRRANCWSVWKWPKRNHSYCCFGDVAEGVLSDTNNPKSDPDRSVAGVLDRNDFDLPATYYGRPDTIEFAEQMILGAKYYNFAWSSPEMNSIGQSILDAFKRADYPFIYNREYKEETVQREDSQKLGWKTTTLTRKPMIADLQTVVKEQELSVYDIRVVEEMRVFIWTAQGKPQAEKGEHDDCVIMVAGLIQLHQRCPLNDDLSWAEDGGRQKMPVAVMGAVDDDDDDVDGLDLMYEEDFE